MAFSSDNFFLIGHDSYTANYEARVFISVQADPATGTNGQNGSGYFNSVAKLINDDDIIIAIGTGDTGQRFAVFKASVSTAGVVTVTSLAAPT